MISKDDMKKLKELDEEIRANYEVDDNPSVIREIIKSMPPCEDDD